MKSKDVLLIGYQKWKTYLTCPGIKVPHPAGPQASPDLNVIKEKYTKQPLFLTEKKKAKEKFQKLHIALIV